MQTITLSKIKESYDVVLEVLNQGGLVIFPSDTVYGLLCDASNPKAVDKLLNFKERPPGKAISVFCDTLGMIGSICTISSSQKKMLNNLLPGAYTVVLHSKHTLVTKLESEKGTLGVRIPKYEPVNELVKRFGKPITATSANLSGKNPHYSLESLLNTLSGKKRELLDLVVDAGKLPHNKPSTVIDLTQEELTVLRVGDTLLKEKQSIITKSEEETRAVASQLISTNYSAEKPLVFILKGDLGSGKTVFTKGIAETYGIDDVVSPTFVIYYEYEIKNGPFKQLYHFDLYNITEEEEFNHLGIEKLLKPGNLFVFEWGEKLGNLYEVFKQQATIVFVELEHLSNSERKLTVRMEP